jgi:hypothetical protein
MIEKIKVKVISKDYNVIQLRNLKYNDESRIEIYLFNNLMVGKGLAISILLIVSLILFAIVASTSFFIGLAIAYGIFLMALGIYDYNHYGERTIDYYIDDTEKVICKIGSIFEYKTNTLIKMKGGIN